MEGTVLRMEQKCPIPRGLFQTTDLTPAASHNLEATCVLEFKTFWVSIEQTLYVIDYLQRCLGQQPTIRLLHIYSKTDQDEWRL